MASPSILEHHPWSVVARLAGHDEEITVVTPHSIVMPIVGCKIMFSFILNRNKDGDRKVVLKLWYRWAGRFVYRVAYKIRRRTRSNEEVGRSPVLDVFGACFKKKL